jgi:hypothetical protein
MTIRGKRVLKNGVLAGYVKQKDGSWRWRFLKRGGGKESKPKTNYFKHSLTKINNIVKKEQDEKKKYINK